MSKSDEAFRTISEVASDLEIPKHVLRFWEAKFPQIRPMKRGGGRRYYRPEDMELLRGIRRLLHTEGYTIKGVQKILRDHGTEHVKTYTLSNPLVGKSKKPLLINGKGSGLSAFIGPRVTTSLPSETLRKSLGSHHTAYTEPTDLTHVLRETISELEACKKLLLGDRSQKDTSNSFVRLRLNRG